MSFHLGKPILVMLVLSALTGGAVLMRPPQRKADVTLWVFADIHRKSYAPLVEQFERDHGCKVNLSLLNSRAETIRLSSFFFNNPASDQVPDLVEIESTFAGQFFRPPLREIGFEPLEPRLRASGWYDQIVPSRLRLWGKQGVIFGAPHDVHPTTLAYRADLFAEAGVDFEAPQTWAELHAACVKFRDYWRARGHPYRHPIELNAATVEQLLPLLLQRGVNLIDDYNRIHLNDPKVADTLALYAGMVAGPRAVGGQFTGSVGYSPRDMYEGHICALLTADWKATMMKRWTPDLSGKFRMRPLPVFEPGDRRTTTNGGTMMCLTKAGRNKDLAFKLVEYLYFDPKTLPERRATLDIIPPITTAWSDPFYHQPDPYFGGQKIGELYTALAPEVPQRYVSPASQLAADALTIVLNQATAYVQQRGTTDGLKEQCQRWLDDAADELRKRVDQWKFD